MGGRLSMPRAPDRANEISVPTRPPRGRSYPINARTLTAPAAALTMALILFVYSRTSIRAAKLNAQRHREADGGQIDWRNESRRRHGQEERIKEGTIREALVEQMKGAKKPEQGEAAAAPARPAGGIGVGVNDETGKALEEAKLRKRFGDNREG